MDVEQTAKNAVALLAKRFPEAPIGHWENILLLKVEVPRFGQAWETRELALKYFTLLVADEASGTKTRGLVLPSIGDAMQMAFLPEVAKQLPALFADMDNVKIMPVAPIHSTRPPLHSDALPHSARMLVYTDRVTIPHEAIVTAFLNLGLTIQLVVLGELYHDTFISFGGLDIEVARKLNVYLESKGVKTWFFEDDAIPGQKLHRVMHDEVNNAGRVLLLCSRSSLDRAGQMNEIERVLERESREGGSSILVPIEIDDYARVGWAPVEKDRAMQLRSRVIGKVDFSAEKNTLDAQLERLLGALKRTV